MPTRSSATHTVPFESILMPYGFDGVSFGVTRSTFSVAMFRRPTRFDPCDVNQMWPFPSNTIVCGSLASPVMITLMAPVAGSSRPMRPLRLPAYQTMPFSSTMSVWGLVPSSISYRFCVPAAGSRLAM